MLLLFLSIFYYFFYYQYLTIVSLLAHTPLPSCLGVGGLKRAAPSAADPEKKTYQTSMDRATSKKLFDQECFSVVDFLNRGGCSFSVAPVEPP